MFQRLDINIYKLKFKELDKNKTTTTTKACIYAIKINCKKTRKNKTTTNQN